MGVCQCLGDLVLRLLPRNRAQQQDNDKLDQVMALLIEMRKEARARKDFATSDQIRNKLAEAGVLLKDEKDGNMSYTIE